MALNCLPVGFVWSYRWELCHFCLATLSDLLKGQPHASTRLPQYECWIIVVPVRETEGVRVRVERGERERERERERGDRKARKR